jgi:hypothetical protein
VTAAQWNEPPAGHVGCLATHISGRRLRIALRLAGAAVLLGLNISLPAHAQAGAAGGQRAAVAAPRELSADSIEDSVASRKARLLDFRARWHDGAAEADEVPESLPPLDPAGDAVLPPLPDAPGGAMERERAAQGTRR